MLSDTTRIRDFDQTALPTDYVADDAGESLDTGFGAEYRGLARQRRFERAAAEAPRVAATPVVQTAPLADNLRSRRGTEQQEPVRAPQAPRGRQRTEIHARAQRLAQAEAPRASYPETPRRATAAEPTRPAPRRATYTDTAAAPSAQPRPVTGRVQRPSIAAPSRHTAPTHVERLSADPMLMIAELSRMADRVIESRESLALASARIVQLERENSAFSDRMLAARALVGTGPADGTVSERAGRLHGRALRRARPGARPGAQRLADPALEVAPPRESGR